MKNDAKKKSLTMSSFSSVSLDEFSSEYFGLNYFCDFDRLSEWPAARVNEP